MRSPCTALVLSGGGARGAYQVGVLQGLAELGFVAPGASPFDVLVGSSAGALNVTVLASAADSFHDALDRLEGVWSSIRPADVFRTDPLSLGRIGARWARDLALGGMTGRVAATSLLDTTPLRSLLAEHVAFDRIESQVAAGTLGALALVATELRTSNGIVFLHAQPDAPLWVRRRWRVERTRITIDHLMASSAIPIFFPPVRIGDLWYSDGSIRNTTPLSPAINLGAERIVAVGVSGPSPSERRGTPQAPTIAEIAGVLLDSVMLDAIEVDVDHSERVNQSVLRCPQGAEGNEGFRSIDVLWLRPSQRIRELIGRFAGRLPRVLRYLLRGLGSDEAVSDLTSYLLFDAEFCTRLIDLGRGDVRAEASRIEKFFA